jgi:hypothetical protein
MPRSFDSRKTLPLKLGEQRVNRAFDDHADVARRINVAHEVATERELLAKFGARRKLDSKARLGKRLDTCRTNSRRDVGPRKASRQQKLDLTFALARHRFEELRVILVGQVFAKKLERRQMDGAGSEQRMDDRKTSPETRGQNTTKCFAFAEAEAFDAELEHRRVASDEVKAPFFDFREVCDELRGDLAMRAYEARDIGE